MMTSMPRIAHRGGIDAKTEIEKGNWQLGRLLLEQRHVLY